MKSKLLKILGALIMLTSVTFIIKAFLEQDVDFSQLISDRYVLVLVVLPIIGVGTVAIFAFAWWRIIEALSGRCVTYQSAFQVYAKSNLGKYLPGNLGHYVGRQVFATSLSMSQSQIALASVMEIALITLSAVIISIVFAAGQLDDILHSTFPNLNLQLLIGVVCVVVIVTIGIFFFVFSSKLSQIMSTLFRLRKVCFGAMGAYTMGLLIIGATLVLTISRGVPITTADALAIIIASVVSWLIGFVTPGAPGGIGVREAVMILMLSPMFGQDTILLAAVIQRAALTLADVLAWGIGLILELRNRT